jgi:hypothetical protein
LAALIVAVVVAIAAGIAALMGKRKVAEAGPLETPERVQAGAQHASERVQAGAQQAYEQAYERARTTSPAVLGAIAAGLVGLVVLLIILRGGPPTEAKAGGLRATSGFIAAAGYCALT